MPPWLGVVEYLYDPWSGSYYFLELNPRLQVEHPCTEMVADVNLPAAQLQIAMGLPLYQIKDIRLLYGESPWGMTQIDFDEPKQRPSPWGHVIAARITSENPDEGFKPSSGTVQELNFRSSKNVWGYFSVAASGGLHEFADSQFGHCFSWGETREQARENLVIALKELSIRGDFRTTVEYLITLLETPAFQNNDIDTSWLDALIAERVQSEKPDVMLGVICGSILIADSIITSHFQEFKNALEKGQIQGSSQLSNNVEVELIHEGVKYRVTATKSGPTSYFLAMNGSFKEMEVHKLTDGGTLLSVDGASYTTYLKDEVDKYRIVIGNQTVVFEKEKDPSSLRAPSAGKLINCLVEDGGHVDKGQPYAEIEYSSCWVSWRIVIGNQTVVFEKEKDPSSLRAPSAGKLINCLVEDGGHVDKGQPYAEIEYSNCRVSWGIVIGNQTVVFEKEKDPSSLRAPSAGKLINCLVEDGGHVDKGQPYAEIEVSWGIVIGNQTVVFEKEKDPLSLRAPSAGKLINCLVEDGGHVDKGQPYAEIEYSNYRVSWRIVIGNQTVVFEKEKDPSSLRAPSACLVEDRRTCGRRTYAEIEVSPRLSNCRVSWRIVIGNQTVVFEKEKDPSSLRAPSAGKLINCLVEDGGHVDKGQPYAEIEVMKMVMTLQAPESGKVTWCLRPGAVLDMGSLMGTLELDDPSLVTRATPYKGQFPLGEVSHQMLTEKLNHEHNKYRQQLDNTLAVVDIVDFLTTSYLHSCSCKCRLVTLATPYKSELPLGEVSHQMLTEKLNHEHNKYRQQLDNTLAVTLATPYKGEFPLGEVSHQMLTEKLNHEHNKYRQQLDNTLAGQFPLGEVSHQMLTEKLNHEHNKYRQQLDNTLAVTLATPYNGELPLGEVSHQMLTEKLNHEHNKYRQQLDNTLAVTLAAPYKGELPLGEVSHQMLTEKLNHEHNKYRQQLDNTLAVTRATPYKGQFPLGEVSHQMLTEKLNHEHNKYRQQLDNTLAGYCLPEPYNTPRLREIVEKFMQSLRDPSLPLLELQEVLSSTSGRIPISVEKKVRKLMALYERNITSVLAQFPAQQIASVIDQHLRVNKVIQAGNPVRSGRIPISVEKKVRKLMALYERNITSVLAQFPAQQIASVIDHHAASIQKRSDRDVFFMSTQALVLLVQRYRNGIRGRMKAAVHDLLKQYYQVESNFQLGSYDKCVMALRDRYKDDMTAVANIIFSHNQVAKKNLLVTLLIDHLWSNEPGLTDELAATLNELTSLHRAEHSRVALRARQVLIAAHQPAYELRHNQMESIFLSAVDMYGHDFHPENLQKLILSETSIFDILHDFFYHTNQAPLWLSALERVGSSVEVTCVYADRARSPNRKRRNALTLLLTKTKKKHLSHA
ncbi:acetyl-CoA carboxylase, central region domain-containing protein [Phthorimaea operculella]|nr:acetyl-CoA carboxylase, central region domain-containing protein [Phthorimaea operculella]